MSEVNPYAAPQAAAGMQPNSQGSGYWRDGNTLIVHRSATLPAHCVKTNGVTEERLKFNFTWHPPWVVALILIAVPVYIVVALALTKRATLDIPLSPERLERRSAGRFRALMLGLASVLAIVLGIYGLVTDAGGAWPILSLLGGLAVGLAAMIYGAMASKTVTPTKIDDQYVYLKGVCPEFLAMCPVWQWR